MKKSNIRKGVYETNSSSTHSICIPEDFTDEMLDFIVPNEDGTIYLNGGEFGGDYEVFNDALTKANYLAVYCEENYPTDTINDVLLKNILFNVIKKQTGCNNIIINFSGDYGNNWSYIDHQSVESKDYHWLFNDEEIIRNFIFNKNAELITDRDG